MANTNPNLGRKGIDILADIMQHMQPPKMRHLLKNLRIADPRIVEELQKRMFTFERLQQCDDRGVQFLLRQISLRDLALALRDADQPLLEKIANNMSRRSIEDLRQEISAIGAARPAEIDAARQRIEQLARMLIEKNQMYLIQGGKDEFIE